MNKTELHLKYKNETSFSAKPINVFARINYRGDGVIDRDYSDYEFFQLLDKEREVNIDLPNPEYHKWLEEKLLELLKT